ncbi:TlyA family RNA methyltransferase [bacterium]|nr:MAG: TlyA family RNA methyltransferase [bacterium]
MRLDNALVERGLAISRSQAQRLIEESAVSCNGQLARKPSQNVQPGDELLLLKTQKFVSRGGEKLDYALTHFSLDVTGKNALDVGSSTGGFCDCLLQRGAAKVFCVDSGSNQLHNSLRTDARVECRESFNARHLQPEDMPFAIEIVVMDVSFISQTLLFPAVERVLPEGGHFVSLVKPQFELSPRELGSGGIVRDEALQHKVLDKVQSAAKEAGFSIHGLTESPIQGGDGNHEWLLWLRR